MIEFDVVFKTPFFEVEESKSEFNEKGSYYRISSLPSVIVCLILESNEIILINQFRPNLNSNTLEFPAGYVEAFESPTEAARREVFEETGLSCNLHFLAKSRLLMNRYYNHEYLFVGLVKNEDIKILTDNVKLFSQNELLNLIKAGKFEHLAALGLLNILNIIYNIDFFRTDSPYNLIAKEIYESKKNQT